jgi:hypothetical protein
VGSSSVSWVPRPQTPKPITRSYADRQPEQKILRSSGDKAGNGSQQQEHDQQRKAVAQFEWR